MDYTFHKIVDMPFDRAVERTTEELAKRGFGVLTTIDVRETLKKKRDIDFRPYVILGACNPDFAHQALLAEGRIGVMLPCNVVVHERDGEVEVAAVDPIASMQAIENPALGEIATQVRGMLQEVVAAL
jgi:uncharacterized protein (DUF302 family)